MKNDPIQTALENLNLPDADLRKALSAKSNLIVAKAARIVGDMLPGEMLPHLAAAFDRALGGFDKGCTASLAIARALVKLDYDDPELFLRGMKHIQMEPVWGKSVDTAAELRAACAIGFTNTRHPHKLRHLVELLVDPEWVARAGAIRAIAAVGSDSASILLRYKVQVGDPEADVLSEAMIGLFETDGAEALPLARLLTQSGDEQVREAAVLALGASRRADAIEVLKERFDGLADPNLKKCILLSLASSRTEPALEFLLGLIRTGSATASRAALDAISLHRNDPRIQQAADEALSGREHPSSHESTDPSSL